MRKEYLCLLAVLFFFGCDMFEYHSYDAKITGETNINAKNIIRIEESCQGKETIRFAFISDTQRFYDETESVVRHLNSRDDIDFVIHGGDIADFGLTNEFMWMRDIMNELKYPYVVLLGNHDCLANGNKVYQKIFGKENFAFQAGNVRFICLNTNALEYDYSHNVPDFIFLAEQAALSDPEQKTVFAMHAAPRSDQFSENLSYIFQQTITRDFPNIQFCINGHGHSYREVDIFEDGIIYYQVPKIEKKQYLLFTIKPGGSNEYEYELVSY